MPIRKSLCKFFIVFPCHSGGLRSYWLPQLKMEASKKLYLLANRQTWLTMRRQEFAPFSEHRWKIRWELRLQEVLRLQLESSLPPSIIQFTKKTAEIFFLLTFPTNWTAKHQATSTGVTPQESTSGFDKNSPKKTKSSTHKSFYIHHFQLGFFLVPSHCWGKNLSQSVSCCIPAGGLRIYWCQITSLRNTS